MDIHVGQIIDTLDEFGLSERSFTPSDLEKFSGSMRNREALLSVLLNDDRFVNLGWAASYECHFVLKNTLLRWFIYLTSRLAQARLAKLTAHQLALSMSSLRLYGKWDTPSSEAINSGHQFGFIATAWTPGYHVFPLAKLLLHLPPDKMEIAISIIKDFIQGKYKDIALQKSAEYWVNEGLVYFDERRSYVIKRREGLLSGKKATLEEIGADMGVTRERVRQIESEFWQSRKLSDYSKVQICFMKGLLFEIMCKQGSLVVDSHLTSIEFMAKCLDIPCTMLPNTELVILGVLPREISLLMQDTNDWTDFICADTIADHLESEGSICLSAADLKAVCAREADFHQEHINKAQRVYLALRSIGRPAHYSEVAEEYNHLFPDCISSEHNVHAVLTREENGVTWIGAKGMFALEEWGYQRPSKSIFETVQEIVEEFYKKTGNPVPSEVILAEISKYRQFVNTSSLLLAAYLNPRLQRVSKNFFIPRTSEEKNGDDISPEELDRILQDF